LLLDRFRVTPPAGAATLRVTAPVELAPPITVEGEIETLASTPRLGAGEVTVSEVLTELDEVAVMLTA